MNRLRIKKKQKVTSGEPEVGVINWRLVGVLAALLVPVLALGYWAVNTYVLAPETQYIIEPYSTPTPAPAAGLTQPTPTPNPAPLTPTAVAVAEAPRMGSAPIAAANAPLVELLTTLPGHGSPISAVAFSPDGRWLASGGQDGMVRIWDTIAGAEHASFQSASNRVDSVDFRADGVLLAVAGQDNLVRLYDVSAGAELAPLVGPSGAVTDVDFSPAGNLLAAASDDGNVYLWNSATGDSAGTLAGHTSYVTSVAFNSDGSILASGGEDDSVRLWKVPSGTMLDELAHSANVVDLAFSPDGRQLASAAADHVIRLWDVASRAQVQALSDHTGNVTAIAYSPAGGVLASAAADIDDDTVRLWNTSTGALLVPLLPPDRVNALAFSPDGRELAAGSAAYVALWGVLADESLAAAPLPTLAPTLAPGGGQGGEDAVVTGPPDVGQQSVGQQSAGQLAADGDTCTITTTYETVNLRAGPGVSYDLVGNLAQGESDTAEGWATGPDGYTWWRLSGSQGWVRADLVTFPDVCFTLPPLQS